MRFKVVVTGWNCADLVPRCVASIASQSDPGVDVCLVDDASEQAQAAIMSAAATRFGWQHIANRRRRGALYNQWSAVQVLEPDPEDVIVFVDADDRLAHSEVLARLRHHYERHRPLMTFGSYVCDPPDADVTPATNFPTQVVKENSYRQFSARDDPDAIWFNHLRTVTHGLFSRLGPTDFTFDDGRWFMACCDTAVMVPCLEMSAGRHLMIPETLYVYTRDNPLSDCRANGSAIEAAHHRIFHELGPRAPLGPIEFPPILDARETP